MADSSELRIVIFGKAKSNNRTVKDLLEENLEQGKINRRKVKMIEAPGIFDPDNNAEDLKKALISCIFDCAPGVHAFILVMKVGKYTDEEKALVSMINMCFGEETLKYTALLYNHGQCLDEGQSIEDFAKTNDDLKKCVEDCGGGVHVIDSKSWNENGRNSTNLKNLIKSIGDIINSHDGGYYTTSIQEGIEDILQDIIKKMDPGETEPKAKAIKEMIKKVTPVLIRVPALVLLSTLVGFKNGFKNASLSDVKQIILNTILGAVKGGMATINAVKGSSDLYEVSDELKKKIKETKGECLIL
ncbi:GTPase IMAP family member 7-like [Paramormyrops kingsleyae]|uniref:GTPase IMAP family member 7-like n=1 Tax=Paramormyrops kingsleyae TaxID=1676925 RepID=UPI003B9773A9